MRLLMVHGSLSVYRLARLIKYSFYKNIAFAFVLFFYQFYCGFSGESGHRSGSQALQLLGNLVPYLGIRCDH
jgi:magnesium-transporting ATPase (P-type)